MRLWANPVAGILPLIISLAFGLAFNWMFYVARLIGGPIMFVWAWALLAYQPVMLLLYYESPPFKGPIVDLAFFAAIAGTGIYGMYRSFDAYPDIVRARTETRG